MYVYTILKCSTIKVTISVILSNILTQCLANLVIKFFHDFGKQFEYYEISGRYIIQVINLFIFAHSMLIRYKMNESIHIVNPFFYNIYSIITDFVKEVYNSK